MRLHPLLRALFWPASLVFQAIVRTRAWLYRRGILKQKRLHGVVISVGNLTVGGTGKTPMVLWLAERLLEEGKKVGILTRGYHPVRVYASSQAVFPALPGRISDEVWVLHTRLQDKVRFGVGADRFARGRYLAEQGIEWFILDDGFQHLGLARDVDIVLVDATDPLPAELLLPAGRLREPPSALARADVLVITRTCEARELEAHLRLFTAAPIFYAETKLRGIVDPRGNSSAQIVPRSSKLFAFCAIGNPQCFFSDLRRWGYTVAGTMAFPDHHSFGARDAEQLDLQAAAAGAEVFVCTEKDWHNLVGGQPQARPVYCCQIDLELNEPEAFWRAVNDATARKRGGAAQ